MTNTMGVPIQKGTLIFWHAVVAVNPRKIMEKCLMEWKPMTSRLIKITMKERHVNII